MINDTTSDAWQNVGAGVFCRRYQPWDLSVGAIVGSEGVTVIDTGGSPQEAEQVLKDVQEAFELPVVAAVNTHAHYDHTFGNQVFDERDIAIYGHRLIPQHYAKHEAPRLASVRQQPHREPDKKWAEVVLTPPSVLLGSPLQTQLGGRALTLLPIDPGHTDTDLAVLVPDARVWFLGDVIEQSGPPMFGSGSYPLSWAAAIRALFPDILLGDTIVPGHGSTVDRAFIEVQAASLQELADEIIASHGRGVRVEDFDFSLRVRDTWPREFLQSAIDADVLSPPTPHHPSALGASGEDDAESVLRRTGHDRR